MSANKAAPDRHSNGHPFVLAGLKMVEKRPRTLRYRRVSYELSKGNQRSFEQDLRAAHKHLLTVADRTVRRNQSYVIEGRHVQDDGSSGFKLHLVAYEEGARATVVPHAIQANHGNTSTTPPPHNTDFMIGNMAIVVLGNQLVVCTKDLRDARLSAYAVGLFEKVGLPDESVRFQIGNVLQMDKLKLLKGEGVRSVSLNAELYQASLHREESLATSRWRALEPIADFMKMFGKDDTTDDITEGENLSVEVTVSMDGRRRGGIVGERRIDDLAKHVVEESAEGFEIVTKRGTPIRADEVLVRKYVGLPIHGNTFDHVAAWDELSIYLHELQKSGVTEQ